MKISWDGRTWSLDLLETTLKQSEMICGYTGTGTLEEWETQLAAAQKPQWARAVSAAYWLMVTQNGDDPGPIGDVDIPYLRFGIALGEAYAAETGAEDPTTAAAPTGGTSTGTTTGSAGSGPGTSENSAGSTFSPSPPGVPALPQPSTS